MTERVQPGTSAKPATPFLRGLRLDRLQPGNALAFFAGLPQRVVGLTTVGPEGDDRALAQHQQGFVDQMTDEMDRLILIVKGHGYPLDPDVHLAEPRVQGKCPISFSRIWAGSNELAQRLTGVAPEEWGDDAGGTATLLSDTQTTIGRVAQLLRSLEELNPDMDDADGSAEVLPSATNDIRTATDDAEALTKSISSASPASARDSSTEADRPGN